MALRPRQISIHVLRVEDDCGFYGDIVELYEFQSTSSVWRTTISSSHRLPPGVNFNPRPPCGGRRGSRSAAQRQKNFNPRPPCGGRRLVPKSKLKVLAFQSTSSVWRTTQLRHEFASVLTHFNPRPPCGGRLHRLHLPLSIQQFQSTSSVWRTTASLGLTYTVSGISIHVLRVEDDPKSPARDKFTLYFNPRPPCGGRPPLTE